jgi:hypothetical protein
MNSYEQVLGELHEQVIKSGRKKPGMKVAQLEWGTQGILAPVELESDFRNGHAS